MGLFHFGFAWFAHFAVPSAVFWEPGSSTPRIAPIVDRFGSIAGVEFLINAPLMFVNRRVADVKLAGDLLVKQPSGQTIYHFVLPFR